jgi:hypothetical protein
MASAWTPLSVTFRIPRILPTALAVQLKLTTSLSNTFSLYMDRLALAQMLQLYQQGPSISVFSGNTNLIVGDTFWLSLYNNYAGKVQGLFDRLFNMKGLNLQLPSNATGGQTIPDSVIS